MLYIALKQVQGSAQDNLSGGCTLAKVLSNHSFSALFTLCEWWYNKPKWW